MKRQKSLNRATDETQATRTFYEGKEGSEGWHNRWSSFREQELISNIKDNEDIARKLANKTELSEFQPNETLYKRGQKADFIFFILSGSVKLFDGNKVLSSIGAKKSIGEFPFLGESPTYTVTAIAEKQSVLAKVKYSDFRVIAAQYKEIWVKMCKKLAGRMKDQLDQEADQLIVMVHGIRTFANWQQPLKAEFKKAGLEVEPTSFDYFDLISFLVPLPWFRNIKITRVSKQLRKAIDSHDGANVSILAHSFGSYIVAEILAAEPDLKVHRVVFCGSIVPSDHPFITQLGSRIKTRVVNDVGGRDGWPALANSVTTGYGHTGTYGFNVPGVDDRWFKGIDHSGFLNPRFCKKYWIPFFKSGEIVEGNPRVESPSLWLQAASVPLFKIKYVVPVLTLLALIWWKWSYLTQICKIG